LKPYGRPTVWNLSWAKNLLTVGLVWLQHAQDIFKLSPIRHWLSKPSI